MKRKFRPGVSVRVPDEMIRDVLLNAVKAQSQAPKNFRQESAYVLGHDKAAQMREEQARAAVLAWNARVEQEKAVERALKKELKSIKNGGA